MGFREKYFLWQTHALFFQQEIKTNLIIQHECQLCKCRKFFLVMKTNKESVDQCRLVGSIFQKKIEKRY